MAAIAWGGRILVTGFTSCRIAQARTNLILLKGCSVIGVPGAFVARDSAEHRHNVEQLFRWYLEGKLRPRFDRVFPLERGDRRVGGPAAAQAR